MFQKKLKKKVPKIELSSYLGLGYNNQDQYSVDFGLMANRGGERDVTTVMGGGTENVSEIVNQPAAYPYTQTEYYTTSPSTAVGEQQQQQTVVPPAPPMQPVVTPVVPVVPPVVSVVPPVVPPVVTPVVVPPVVQPVVQAPCCPTGWMGTHTHETSSSGSKPTMMTKQMESSVELTGELTSVFGETGELVNRAEILGFSGPIPLTDYPINKDPNPEVIRKSADPPFVDYIQEVSVRYLRPHMPPAPGEIIVRQGMLKLCEKKNKLKVD